jgi:hypothetical protein
MAILPFQSWYFLQDGRIRFAAASIARGRLPVIAVPRVLIYQVIDEAGKT